MFPMSGQEEIFAQSEAASRLCVAVPAFHTPGWQAACVGQLLWWGLLLCLPGLPLVWFGEGHPGNTTI